MPLLCLCCPGVTQPHPESATRSALAFSSTTVRDFFSPPPSTGGLQWILNPPHLQHPAAAVRGGAGLGPLRCNAGEWGSSACLILSSLMLDVRPLACLFPCQCSTGVAAPIATCLPGAACRQQTRTSSLCVDWLPPPPGLLQVLVWSTWALIASLLLLLVLSYNLFPDYSGERVTAAAGHSCCCLTATRAARNGSRLLHCASAI